jgi:hypothetical protein
VINHVLLHVVRAESVPGEPFPRIGLAVIYEFATDRFVVAEPADVDHLRQVVAQADRVSGFDLFGVGFPAVFEVAAVKFPSSPAYRVVFGRAYCLTQIVGLSLGQAGPSSQVAAAWTLDATARGTLDRGRRGDDGKVGEALKSRDMAGVVNYALDDAALVRDLVLFEQKYGYLIHERSKTKLVTRGKSIRPADMFGDASAMMPSGAMSAPFTQAPASAEGLVSPENKR